MHITDTQCPKTSPNTTSDSRRIRDDEDTIYNREKFKNVFFFTKSNNNNCCTTPNTARDTLKYMLQPQLYYNSSKVWSLNIESKLQESATRIEFLMSI